jgi:hypothetical protein
MAKNQLLSVVENRQRQIGYVPIRRLLLDVNNPRLSSGVGAKTQFEVLKVLWTEMAIDELVLSIAANSFFPEEPLFVIPEKPGDDPADNRTKLVVVEGNRRLAAVLILRDDELRQKLRATDMPVIDETAKAQLDTLPVSIYESREQLWSFLVFRHINSPMAWDSFSKARYVTHVYDDYGVSLEDIAKRTGDRHSLVVRLYRGYKVVQQVESQGVFNIEDRVRNRFYFSHLYTALSYPEFQEFLGIDDESSLTDNPVPASKLSHLGELMTWLYGNRSKNVLPLVQKQNPHLNWLREVINKPESLDALRSGYSLERSYEISIGDRRRFREALTKAKEESQQAKATVTTGYNGEEDLYKTAEDIQEIIRTIRSEMKPKYERAIRQRRR